MSEDRNLYNSRLIWFFMGNNTVEVTWPCKGHYYVFRGDSQNPHTPDLMIERAQEMAVDKSYDFSHFDSAIVACTVTTLVADGVFDMDLGDMDYSE